MCKHDLKEEHCSICSGPAPAPKKTIKFNGRKYYRPDEDRLILWGGLKPKELAKLFGVSVEAIYHRRNRLKEVSWIERMDG